MLSANLLGILSALASACVWGSADFSGGLATRQISQFQVLVLSSLSGSVLLLGFVAVWGEACPSPGVALWAGLAGIAGALGIAALYRGLALGNAASVAPTAAVIGTVLPVLFGTLTQGLPSATQLAGFALALLGIWLVARASTPGSSTVRQGLGLAFLAGVGFGGFFILIAQGKPGELFAPLLIARMVAFGLVLLLVLIRRMPLPSPGSNPIALLAGVLDAGGNIFYLLAKQFTRLDVAVVLSSLYPAVTVLLAYLVLKEKVSRSQWMGAGVCLAAVALIAL